MEGWTFAFCLDPEMISQVNKIREKRKLPMVSFMLGATNPLGFF